MQYVKKTNFYCSPYLGLRPFFKKHFLSSTNIDIPADMKSYNRLEGYHIIPDFTALFD